jgi:hypothetical protein
MGWATIIVREEQMFGGRESFRRDSQMCRKRAAGAPLSQFFIGFKWDFRGRDSGGNIVTMMQTTEPCIAITLLLRKPELLIASRFGNKNRLVEDQQGDPNGHLGNSGGDHLRHAAGLNATEFNDHCARGLRLHSLVRYSARGRKTVSIRASPFFRLLLCCDEVES